MGILIASGAVPRTITPASAWNGVASTLNAGKWRFTFTPTNASTNGAFSDWKALVVANDVGGCYLEGNTHEVALYNNNGGGTKVVGRAITWTAGQAITVTFDIVAGANASSLTISGAATGNGTTNFTTSGTYFTSSVDLGIGRYPGDVFFDFTGAGGGTIGAIDDTLAAGASGAADVGGVTGSGAAITGTFASGSANVGGITSSGASTSPGAASGSSAVGGITSSGAAASPAVASGSASVGGITGTGSAGQSLFGTIGASAQGQRIDQSGPATGTMTTAYAARTPSSAVAINDQLAFNSRRWLVHTPGTLGAGSGPTGTGQQADGTASLVALTSTDTALAMTTQPSNSVMLAVLMRENWTSDTSAPTDNKGNTYALVNGPHAYTGFPSAQTALYAKTNAVGGASHVLSATWPVKNVTGAEMSLLAVEVPTGRATAIVQDASFVERSSAASVTSVSVTTTGPAVLVGFWLGTGGVITVGTTHPGAPQAPFTAIPNADTAVAIHNNGYIQGKSAYAYVTAPGTYTVTWTGTSEGAQLYLVAIQEAPGTSASGAASVGGITGAGVAGPAASGAANVAGVSSTGATSSTTAGAGGAASVGGIGSAGQTSLVASGAASVAGISSTGTTGTGTNAAGASAVGGIASSGATIPGTSATGTSAVGGIASSGVVSVPSSASGSATVGGVQSAGEVSVQGVASGSASVGGVQSAGDASSPGFASGAAIVGGVQSTGSATGPATVPTTPPPTPAASFEDLVEAMDRVIMDILG